MMQKQSTLAYSLVKACDKKVSDLVEDPSTGFRELINLSLKKSISGFAKYMFLHSSALLDPEFLLFMYQVYLGNHEKALKISRRIVCPHTKNEIKEYFLLKNEFWEKVKTDVSDWESRFYNDISALIENTENLPKIIKGIEKQLDENYVKCLSHKSDWFIENVNLLKPIKSSEESQVSESDKALIELLETLDEIDMCLDFPLNFKIEKSFKGTKTPLKSREQIIEATIGSKGGKFNKYFLDKITLDKIINERKSDLKKYKDRLSNLHRNAEEKKKIATDAFQSLESGLSKKNVFEYSISFNEAKSILFSSSQMAFHYADVNLSPDIDLEMVSLVKKHGFEKALEIEKGTIKPASEWLKKRLFQDIGDIDSIKDLQEWMVASYEEAQKKGKPLPNKDNFALIFPVEKEKEDERITIKNAAVFSISEFFKYSTDISGLKQKKSSLKQQIEYKDERVKLIEGEINRLLSSDDIKYVQNVLNLGEISKTLEKSSRENINDVIENILVAFKSRSRVQKLREINLKEFKRLLKYVHSSFKEKENFILERKGLEEQLNYLKDSPIDGKLRLPWVHNLIKSTIQAYVKAGDIFTTEDIAKEVGFSDNAVKSLIKSYLEPLTTEQVLFKNSELYCSDEVILNRLTPSIKEPAVKRKIRIKNGRNHVLSKPHIYPLGTEVNFYPIKPRNRTLQTTLEVKEPLLIEPSTEQNKLSLRIIRAMKFGRVKNAFECEKIVDAVGGGEKYVQQYKERFTDLHANMCRVVLGHIKNGDRVLDLGCGSGSPVLKAITFDGKIVDYSGLDTEEKVVEQNIKDYRQARFVQCRIPYDLSKLDGSEQFDHVTASFFFPGNNLHEKVATLLYVNSVLKKGGKITALIPKGGHDTSQVLQILKGLGYRTENSEIGDCYRVFYVTDKDGEEIPHYCYEIQAEKVTDYNTRQLYELYTAIAALKAKKVGISNKMIKGLKFPVEVDGKIQYQEFSINNIADFIDKICNADKQKSPPVFIVDFNKLDGIGKKMDAIAEQLSFVETKFEELKKETDLFDIPTSIEKQLSESVYQQKYGKGIGKTIRRLLTTVYEAEIKKQPMIWTEFLGKLVKEYKRDKWAFFNIYMPSDTLTKKEYAAIPGKNTYRKRVRLQELVGTFLIPYLSQQMKL